MSYHIRILKPAQEGLGEICRYIAEDLQNRSAAVQFLDRIDKAIQSLKENPVRFPLARDAYLASKGYRLLVAKKHLIFFAVREDIETVSVMRILYGRRDWVRLLKADKEQ